jgi:hypothetical protein
MSAPRMSALQSPPRTPTVPRLELARRAGHLVGRAYASLESRLRSRASAGLSAAASPEYFPVECAINLRSISK